MTKTPRTEAVVKMAVGPMREYAIIKHAQTLERELLKAQAERDEARRTIADMHAAAMGCIMPPRAGLVADMVVLREENKTNFCLMEDFRRETQQLREEIERIKRGECIECANYSEDVEQAKRERDEARELAKVYKEYTQLISDELNETVAFAYAHGWRSSRFERGEVLREKIKQLEAAK